MRCSSSSLTFLPGVDQGIRILGVHEAQVVPATETETGAKQRPISKQPPHVAQPTSILGVWWISSQGSLRARVAPSPHQQEPAHWGIVLVSRLAGRPL